MSERVKKLCPHCSKEKEINTANFHRDKSRATGFHSICKPCKRRRTLGQTKKNPLPSDESRAARLFLLDFNPLRYCPYHGRAKPCIPCRKDLAH